jgi:Putative serine esterase (DUF676)
MQNHYISGDINKSKMRRAYWAFRPNGVVIIFVHGLLGEAVGTWSNFESLLLKSNKCQGCDIIFYKYNSTDDQTHASSKLFYGYLSELLTNPAKLINRDSMLLKRRGAHFQYTKVILIAHSLGSIICRQALLEAYSTEDNWRDLIDLVLFAPAHLGSRNISGFVEEFAAALGVNWIVTGAKLFWPTLGELERNSDTLQKLERETRKALRSRNAACLKAKRVVFGQSDKVVIIGDFCSDEKYKIFAGKGHKDVCKPKDGFLEPLDVVLERL